MNFWVLGNSNDGALLDAYPEGPEGWRYLEPQSLVREVREGVAMRFSPNFPDRRKIYDFVDSILNLKVVSDSVRRIVAELAPGDVEFLPVTLLNHQGDVASREHFIMNPLHRRPVIALENSTVVMSPILKTEIKFVDKLALKQDIDPSGPRIFRPVHLRTQVFVDATLHDALDKSGLKGFQLLAAHGWNGDLD